MRRLGHRRKEEMQNHYDSREKEGSELELQREDHPKYSWEGKGAPRRAAQKHLGQHRPMGLTERNRASKSKVDLEGVKPGVPEEKVC